MKKSLIIFLLLVSFAICSQQKKSSVMGQTSLEELQMIVYDKDSTAAAVVLYEHANVYLDPKNDYNTRTDFYYRIKILDKTAFEQANISIGLYKKKKAINIQATTYNLSEIGTIKSTAISKDKIFTVQETEEWTSLKFTMPNIAVGSVIEYSYSVLSPYLGMQDWYFQSDIPKIKSEFDAAVLGNYEYNIRIIGFLKLNKDDASLEKKCVYIEGIGQGACVIYTYGMYDIPAFKKEDYMLSEKNYMARLSFDLKSYTSPRGNVENYTTTWKQADKKLKKIFFNNQTSKKSFFKKRIPEHILSTQNKLEKAIAVYKFIQNHYTWNDKYWNNEDEEVKDAFNEKIGSAGEINLSLYNALEALDIEAELVILSTRNNGLPTTLYPIIFDFNYLIIKIIIDGEDIYLDATDKYLPFGQVPIRTLNGQARIINYKKESNWVSLNPKIKSSKNVTANLILKDNNELTGNLLIRTHGYAAQKQRKKLKVLGIENYLEEFETNNPDIEVEDYRARYQEELENPLQEVFKINVIMGNDLTQKIRINPFFFDRQKENPFKLKERNYPVDFGYAKKNSFLLSLEIPDTYKVTQLLKEVAISLPNKGGSFILKVLLKDKIIKIYSRMTLSKKSYTSEEYFALKEFFKQIVIAENAYLTLEKK